MSKKILLLILGINLLITGSLVVYLTYYETMELKKQEQTSELVAEEYLIHISEAAQESNSDNISNTDLEYIDNDLYKDHTESEAWGHIDCVLEIPAIELRQSIYTGTPAQIEHDLEHWLCVTGRSDYILGDTHYCIYMHNPKNKSLKISLAQDTLKNGDYLVITNETQVYLYEITGVYPEWRDICKEDYVDNMSISNDKLYIFSCARNEWQGRNLVIEGTLYQMYSVVEWTQNKDECINEYKSNVQITENVIKENLILDVSAENETLTVSLQSPDYTMITGCTIGIYNVDGYLIECDRNPIPFEGNPIQIPKLESGEYFIGVHENPTIYETPVPYTINIDKNLNIQTVTSLDEEVSATLSKVKIMQTIAIVCMCGTVMMFGTVIVRNRKEEKTG